jgi:hypothetical protein
MFEVKNTTLLLKIQPRPLSLYYCLKKHHMSAIGVALGAGVCWITWITLIIVQIGYLYSEHWKAEGIYALAWVFYMGFVTIITATRVVIRENYGINGNPVEDFFAVLFVYPCVMIQLETVNKRGGLSPLMPDNRQQHETPAGSNVIENRAREPNEKESVA